MLNSFGRSFRVVGAIPAVPALAVLLLVVGMPAARAQHFSDRDTLAPVYPTPETVVDKMLTVAGVRPGEMVYDLGCGDGRILIAAAQKFRARAVGIEIRRDIYEGTLARVASLGLSDQVHIVHGNALKYDLSPADVVTLYLLTSSNERLKPILEKELKPSARVVSHDFEIRGWKPVTASKMVVDGHAHMIYLYRINAR
jgi:precorrin-6B methylase 2